MKRLKKDGYYVIVNTTERGMEIFQNNPNIDKLIEQASDLIPNNELPEYWDKLKKDHKPDKFINFSESIEINISLHRASPEYNYTKAEREKYTHMNFYEETYKWAGYDDFNKQYVIDQLPEIFLTEEEEKYAKSQIKKNHLNVLIGLSGSGNNKVYPHTYEMIRKCLKLYKDIYFITVGDERCKALEYLISEHAYNVPEDKKRIKYLSGKITMRDSIALAKHVDLLISPDTGLLHGAGCFDTATIGLFGHTTIENITKYFNNDYSIEADREKVECAPCGRLIYTAQEQCPTDIESRAAWCMHYGITPSQIIDKIKIIRENMNV